MDREPIVTSRLDTDFYKFTMSRVIQARYPSIVVEWAWKSRSKDIDPTPFKEEIEWEINQLEHLRFQKEELEYLGDIRFVNDVGYLEYLRNHRLYPKDHVNVSVQDGKLSIRCKASWATSTWYELHVLPIVSEVWTRNTYPNPDFTEAKSILENNIKLVNSNYLKWSCFGTRRRFSKAWQHYVTEQYVNLMRGNFMGTSNVFLAKKHGISPIGTMAHEMQMVMQALVRVADSVETALESWVQVFRGDLGIALTDNLGVDFFLKICDLYFTKLFDGFRHDSGDPYQWGEKIIAHIREHRINPLNKDAVFTDGNSFSDAVELKNYFMSRINTRFGIGTKSTNDLGSKYPPLQHVMKPVKANGCDIAKVSDSSGKEMCESPEHEAWVRHVIKEKLKG